MAWQTMIAWSVWLIPSTIRKSSVNKYMERRGSGFKKIREDYKGQYLYSDSLKPEFYSDRSSFILTLKNLNYKKGAEKGAETRKAVVVEKRIEKAFELIKENPEITQTDIMDKMNVSRKQVQNATNETVSHSDTVYVLGDLIFRSNKHSSIILID